MLRILATLFLQTLIIHGLYAQAQSADSDPTHWLNYAQTYYKIPIAQPGIYRVTPTQLQQAGIPVMQIDPTTVQLFHRGVEQAIYLDGETDHRFDPDDFLEFYGRGNDGAQDSLLYRPMSARPHNYYSLFSDTTAYFLTWRIDGKPGKRMTAYTDTAYASLTPERYHWEEDLRLFTDDYPGWAAGIPPSVETSYYDPGEGYTGVIQTKDKPVHTPFQLTDAVRSDSANGVPNPIGDLLVVGRDFTNHRIDWLTGPTTASQRTLDTLRFSVYHNARSQRELAWPDVGADGKLVLSTVSRNETTTADRYSVSYLRLRYPQRLTANGQPERLFHLAPNQLGKARLDVTAVLPHTRFWDISDPTSPIRVGATSPAPNTARLIVQGTSVARTLLLSSQPKTVPTIQPVSFTNWANRRPTYLIISHENLMQPASSSRNPVRAYAAYRASAAGGGHDTLMVTMQQLIDQYSYGERHPLAIRRFVRQLLEQSRDSPTRPQYLLLLGRSRSTPGIRRDPRQTGLDLVMTGGFPGSDLVFSAGLDGWPTDVPALPTGRINAGTPQEVIDYLNKVRDYERSSTDLLWRKNLLHLSGGETPVETTLLRQLVDSYRDQATGQSLGARVTTQSKETEKLVEQLNVAKRVNEGVGLMTFFGHSGIDVTDLDIGFCSNDALGYRNKGKYPLLLVNGCAIGNFFYGRPTLVTDWVLTPDRGAIAAVAHSHLGYTDLLHAYSSTFYQLLTDSTQLSRSIGQLQQETVRRVLIQTPELRTLANAQQMVLQGDPAIRLFPFQTPDYSVTAGNLTVLGMHNQPLTALSDSVQIRIIVQNVGQYRNGRLPIQVRRLVDGQESGVFNLLLSHTVAYRDTLTLTIPNDRTAEGLNQFIVTVNPTDLPTVPALPETNHADNQAAVEVTMPGTKPVLIYPAPGSIVTTTTLRLAASYFGDGPHEFEVELDSTARFDSPIRLTQRLTATNFISYAIQLLPRPNTTYYWRVRLASPPPDPAVWSTSSFVYAPTSVDKGLPEGQIWLAGKPPVASQQGDTIRLPVQFTNLSPYAFTDSLVARQTIYAAGLSSAQTTEWRVKAPTDGDTLRFTVAVPTGKLPGFNRVVLTVNPRLQPEYSFLNNTLDLPLPVLPDQFAPLLDVAFDGARISDGEVISAQPRIDVLIADENRSLIRCDTTGLDLYLQRPGGSFERLSWRTATVQTGTDNVFRIQYPAPKLPEGEYHVLVTARDAVGNQAVPYQIRFRVVDARKLTGLTAYPNPFRDQIRFAFHLTGDQAPNSVMLTLTDLTGRVVRQLNPVSRVGMNEWFWDGSAKSGEPLPAGVYMYTLTVLGADGSTWPVVDGLNGHLSGRILLIR